MQMHLLSDRIRKRILTLIIASICASCSNIAEQSNQHFLKTYEKDVGRINSNRNDPVQTKQNSFENKRNWQDSIEIFNFYESTHTARTARIDTSKIKLPEPPEESLPSMKTFKDGRTRDLPDDMFHVSYNPYNFPNSYGRAKLSFDDIAIPSRDAFGIETALGEKNYQLINHKTLQRDIDFSKKNRSLEDVEISSELILEEKQAKRKKYLEQKNYGKSDEEDIYQGESEDQITSKANNLPKNTTSDTILKVQIIEKISVQMNTDEKKNLMDKYQADIEKMVQDMNKELDKEENKNLSDEEKKKLMEKEMADMVLEMQKIMLKSTDKSSIIEASSK